VADTTQDLDVVALEAHAGPTTEPESPAGQLVGDVLDEDGETGGETLDDHGERGAV